MQFRELHNFKKNAQISPLKYRKNKYFYRGIKGIYLVLFNKTISKLVYKMEHKGDKK